MSNLWSVHVLPKRCQQEITPCLSLLLLLEICQRHPFRKRKCKRTKNRGCFAKFPAGVCRPRPQSNITYTVEKVEEPSGNDAAQYEQLLDKLAIRKQRAKEAYLDGIDTKEEYRENRELIDAEVKSIKEKLATLETAAVITTTEEFHVDIREIILKLKDDTLSTLEKHTALASILDYMEYDKEKDEYSFYYKFEE